MADGTRQSFQLLRQITWFLRNGRVLSKFKYPILHYLISNKLNHKENSP